MYRRHLKMVLMKDIESNKTRSEFFHRISSIPVVYLAWNIASDTYNIIKSSNKVFNLSLTTTERAALYFSRPVLNRLSKQLEFADYLACRGLETIQGIVPNIKHQQQKIYQHTKSIYDDTVESGLRKYAIIKHIGSAKVVKFVNKGNQRFEEICASPYGEVCDLSLDIAFGACELYVDQYLPPLGDERPEIFFGDRSNEPKWSRAKNIRNRIKERLYKHSLLKLQTLRIRTKFAVARVFQFNLYQYLVEVTTAIPGVASTVVLYIFSSIEILLAYLVSIFVGQIEDSSTRNTQI